MGSNGLGDARQTHPQLSNWKFYNSYERQDPHRKNKDLLRDEINNIALRIVKVREAKNSMKFNPQTRLHEGAWRVPDVEAMDKKFNEATRFFKLPEQRKNGLKFVPPPVTENFQQLKEEQKYFDQQRLANSSALAYMTGGTRSQSQQQEFYDMLERDLMKNNK